MFKKNLIIFLVLALTGCSAPGSALLGPVFTGATTGSVSQASISFGTNQIMKKIHETSKKTKNQVEKIAKKVEDFDLETKSKDFYASVKNLYLQDQQYKHESLLFHR
tara:strand:- start:81 stop:401 length:321 start_codon:yes stop_codon:yes gene_type:complete